MAPVFSRSTSKPRPLAIPPDIVVAIAGLLRRSDKRAMLLCCWMFHDAIAPLLYRHLDVWFQPASWERSEGYDHKPYSILSTLTQSAHHAGTRCYPCYVLTFRYLSHSLNADLRGVPLLTEFLRFAVRLRHLALDVHEGAVPLLLDSFHRHDITRSFPPSLINAIFSGEVAKPWILPRLDSIRSPKLAIVSAFMRFRGIRTAMIDTLPNAIDMDAFLNPCTPRAGSLLRLALSLPPHALKGISALRAIALVFPELQYLALRTATKLGEDFFLSYLLLTWFQHALALLETQEYVLPKLRFFSVNLSSNGVDHMETLKKSEDRIQGLGESRASLTTVALGDAMWERGQFDARWILRRSLRSGAHMWAGRKSTDLRRQMRSRLERYSQSSIHLLSLVLHDDCLGCRYPHALQSSCTMGDLVSNPSLSAFEHFLLTSEGHLIKVFFSFWTPDLILHLRRLSSAMYLGIEAYCAHVWDADAFLSRWFAFVPTFLRVLDLCEGVVSGSEAQQFLGRREFRGKDLDIYVPLHGLLPMGRWLKNNGFVYQPTSDKHPLFDVAAFTLASAVGHRAAGAPLSPVPPYRSPTSGIFDFTRPRHSSQALPTWLDGTHIQVMAVPCNPVEFIVNNFHSTAVMNYMTGKYAVSIFPRTTYVERQLLVCQDVKRDAHTHQEWMDKYRRRGFTIIGAGGVLPRTVEARCWERSSGDFLTWILPYERRGE
ncbi:hypothetical protein C8Q70DRAFT_911313 [Cubamyces menziesii]|nr:hypothetical protein C8Q70DRAFT_911313 [Cubamyces menziesii]